MHTEVMRFDTVEEMEDYSEELLEEGGNYLTGMWKVWQQYDSKIVMVRHGGLGNPWIHLIIFVLISWWLLFLPTLGYAGAYYFMNSYYLELAVKRTPGERSRKSSRASTV